MSYALQDAVWEIKGLKATAKIVLLRLAHHAHDLADAAFPSVETLAEYTGLARRTVTNALVELQQRGFIRAVGGHTKGGRGRSTRWLLILETTQEMRANPETAQNLHVNRAGDAHEPIREPDSPPAAPAREADAIPDQWQPDPLVVASLAQRYPHMDLMRHAENFADWCRLNGKRSPDFTAYWVTWVRKDVNKSEWRKEASNGGQRGSSSTERLLRGLALDAHERMDAGSAGARGGGRTAAGCPG